MKRDKNATKAVQWSKGKRGNYSEGRLKRNGLWALRNSEGLKETREHGKLGERMDRGTILGRRSSPRLKRKEGGVTGLGGIY